MSDPHSGHCHEVVKPINDLFSNPLIKNTVRLKTSGNLLYLFLILRSRIIQELFLIINLKKLFDLNKLSRFLYIYIHRVFIKIYLKRT